MCYLQQLFLHKRADLVRVERELVTDDLEEFSLDDFTRFVLMFIFYTLDIIYL